MQTHTDKSQSGVTRKARKVAALLGIASLAITASEASAAKRVPADNLTKNPSFAKNTKGWTANSAKVRRVKTRRAPQGRSVARVRAKGRPDSYTIDDLGVSVSPDETEGGATYRATAFVRAERRSRNREVGIVVRETNPAGEWVADSEGTVRLSPRRYRKLATRLTASADGNQIDVYLRRASQTRRGEAISVDAVSLVKIGGTTPPAEEPPAEEPPAEEPPAEEPPAEEPPAEEPPAEEPPAEEPPAEEPPAEEPPAEEPPSGESPITTSQVALVTSHESPLFDDDGSKYAYIMIRDSISHRVGELRQVHPEAKILLYKNVAFTVVDENCEWAPLQGAGVDYCQVNTKESWFLHHKNTGARLASSGYEHQRAMDIGNPAYQQKWIDSVTARLRDARNDGSNVRLDGVWMDDTNLYPGHGMDGKIAEFSDAQYRQRMLDFIDRVGPELKRDGFMAVPNIGMNPWESAQRDATLEVAEDVSMINREGLVRWGEGTTWTDPDGDAPFWRWEVELAEDIQAAGAEFHAMTYGTNGDSHIQRYARATFLMAWDGSEGSAFNYRTSNGGEWTSDWTTDVGTPTGGRYRVGQGWKRDFSAGTVVVNARAGGSQSFNLGGQFEKPDGSCTNSVTLSATRAMVMPAC